MAFLLLLALGGTAVGALVGRWTAIGPVAAVWPLYMLGLERGWWGHGVGDGWQLSLAAGAAVAAAGAALGVVARRRFRPPSTRLTEPQRPV